MCKEICMKTFAQVIAQLPYANFSFLDLNIYARGHAFGPVVFHLLRNRPVVQRLRIFMEDQERTVNTHQILTV